MRYLWATSTTGLLVTTHTLNPDTERRILWQFFFNIFWFSTQKSTQKAKRGLILKTLIFHGRGLALTELPAELTATQRWLPVTRGWYGQWLHWIARTRTTHQRHNDEKQSTHKSLLLSRFQTSLCLCHPVLRLPTHRDLLPFHANGRHTSVIHDQSLF